MNTKKTLLLILLLLIAQISRGQEVVEAIVAIVNDDIITLSDYRTQHDILYQQLQSQLQGEEFSAQYAQARENLLDMMITSILLLQEAERQEIDVTEQLLMFINNIKEENGFESDLQLRRALQQQGISFEEWKDETEMRFLREAVIFAEVGRHIVLDDSELLSYYRQHPEEFTEAPEFRLKAIYISEDSKTEDEVQTKKQEVQEKLSGDEDFGAVASTYSEGPEKDNQGDLGSFKQGELAAELEQEVGKLNEGETTPWIHTVNGWYLLHLVEKKGSRITPFEEVRNQIQSQRYQERQQADMGKYIEKLKAKSYIKIMISDPYEKIR